VWTDPLAAAWEREATLASATAVSVSVGSGGARTATYRLGTVACATVERYGGPVEHYAKIAGSVRAPLSLEPTMSGPTWAAGLDVVLAEWANAMPDLIFRDLPWSHGGAFLPWFLQLRPNGNETVAVFLAGDRPGDGSGFARFADVVARLRRALTSCEHYSERKFLVEPRLQDVALAALDRVVRAEISAVAEIGFISLR
jgi:hypothetical protein